MLTLVKAHAGAMLLCMAAWAQAAQAPADPPKAEIDALGRGFAALEAEKPDAALDAFHGLSASANPDMAALALEGMASAYRQKLEFAKTVAAYEQSLALPTTMPRDLPAIHRQIGMAAVLAGSYDTAVKHLTIWKNAWASGQGSKPDEHTPTVLLYMAVALAEQRRYPEAMEAIGQSAALKPRPSADAVRAAIDSAAKSGNARPGAIGALLKSGR
ncbi:hypothetical protein [Bordetella sp. 2513F-2]